MRMVLSTFRVNTTLDTVAVNLKNGKDASGQISLRSAIMAANAKPNSDTIVVPSGTFLLTIPGSGGFQRCRRRHRHQRQSDDQR